MKGTQTVRGRSTKVDPSFIDIVGKSDTLVALMGNFEARNGPLALFGDLVWSKVGIEGTNVRTRTPAPGITGMVGRTLALDVQMASLEVVPPMRSRAPDRSRSMSSAVPATGTRRRTSRWRSPAPSTSTTWSSPGHAPSRGLVLSTDVTRCGARVRHAVAPGHELFLRGDIGGVGVGSDFSWQAIGGFDFGAWNGITSSGVIGYRALSVDYAEGNGRRRYEFDMLQHEPVLGLSMRW